MKQAEVKSTKGKVPCEHGCGAMVSPGVGQQTHNSWAHNPASRAKRIKAAREMGQARIGTKRKLKIKKKASRFVSYYDRLTPKQKRDRAAKQRQRRLELSQANGAVPVRPTLQHAANFERLIGFLNQCQVINEALAYVEARS
jgi:hypothetical protein